MLKITGVKYFSEQAGASNICASFISWLYFFLFHRVRKYRVNSYASGALSNAVVWVSSAGRRWCIS